MNKRKLFSWVLTFCVCLFYFYYFYFIFSSYRTISNNANEMRYEYDPSSIHTGYEIYNNQQRYVHLRDNLRRPNSSPNSNETFNMLYPRNSIPENITEEMATAGFSISDDNDDIPNTLRPYGRCEINKKDLSNRNNKILIDLGDITNQFQIKISDFWLELTLSRDEFSRNLPLYFDIAIVKDYGDRVKIIPGSIITQKLTRENSLEIIENQHDLNIIFKIRPKNQQMAKFNSPEVMKSNLSLMISVKSDSIFKCVVDDLRIDFFG